MLRANEKGKILLQAESERRLLTSKYHIAPSSLQSTNDSSRSEIDAVSSHILRKCQPLLLNEFKPVAIYGDGNCLFRALSEGIFGTQDHHLCIRLLTALEMIENPEFYDDTKEKCKILIGNGTSIVIPNYEDAVKSVCSKGSYMGLLQMYAASAALSALIYSFCPPANSRTLLISEPLIGRVLGRNVKIGDPRVNIMCTQILQRTDFSNFISDHFFVLEAKKQSKQILVDLSPQSREKINAHNTGELRDISTDDSRNLHTEVFDCEAVDDPHSTIEDCASFASDNDNTNDSLYEPADANSIVPATSESENESKEKSLDFKISSFNENTSDAIPDPSFDEREEEKMTFNTGKPNHGVVHKIEDIYSLIMTSSKQLEKLPTSVGDGQKSDFTFVLNNTDNINRKKNSNGRLKSIFYDKCGVWDPKHSRTVKTYYHAMENEAGVQLKVLVLRDGDFCTRRRSNKKVNVYPLEDQPSNDNVICLNRYYSKLKYDLRSHRIVSWIEFPNRELPENFVAIHQYLGNFETSSETDHFKRTKPEIMEKIKQSTEILPSRVYQDLLDQHPTESFTSKTLRSAKYREKKKTLNNFERVQTNVADDILKVMDMATESSFVRYSIISSDGPIIIMFNNSQILDMKSSLESGSVLGMDKTYNLCPYFLSTFTYQNLKVVKKETKRNPVMIGPMMLHCNSSFETYNIFCSIVRGALEGSEKNASISFLIGEEIAVGSDEEKAITKALSVSFPNSPRFLCKRHLKQNVIKHLENKVGATRIQRNRIVHDLFGDEGIANSDTTFDFEEKVNSLICTDTYQELPTFQDYFENKLKNALLNSVVQPQIKHKKDNLWTNNFCESINKVFRQVTDWKDLKLHEVVIELEKLVSRRLTDLQCSLYKTGNYELVPCFKKLSMTNYAWENLSPEQRNEAFKELLNSKNPESKTEIQQLTSRSSFAIRHHSNAGKKPQQSANGSGVKTCSKRKIRRAPEKENAKKKRSSNQ